MTVFLELTLTDERTILSVSQRFYYEYWKRYNSVLALEWGMTTFEDEETERPEFDGEEIESPVDGSKIRYFSPQHRFRRVMSSLVRSIIRQRWRSKN